MPVRAEQEFSLPHLILCEGPEDVSFFRALIERRHLTRCHVRHTGKDRHDRGGNRRFAEKLKALRIMRTFRTSIKSILIVTDSDADPAASFAEVKAQLASLWPVPPAPLVKSVGSPSLTVLLLPPAGPGNLECICQEAARVADQRNAAFVDHFVSTVTGGSWPLEKEGKLWLRASVAARWQVDPCINVAPLFQHPHANRLIALEHSSLDWVAREIERFTTSPPTSS